ncbi:MAG: ZIP family metal transporter [Chloracidobacterium sp.]|nr:ZIP family metal transporter [Chloracidobacterium sp.]
MDPLLIRLIIFGLCAGAANVLGGAILFPSQLQRSYRKYLKYLLAVGAGFMLAVTIFEILPRTVELWQTSAPTGHDALYIPMLLFMGGYLLTQFFEHTIAPHIHLGEEMHCDDASHGHEIIPARSAYTAVAGLLVHTFFDGVSIAAASQIDLKAGLLVFVAVILHKFPEGFTIGSMVLAAGKGTRQVLASTSLIGLATFAGVMFFYFLGSNLGFTAAYALPIAGGVTLYVAASDLIPEVNHHGGKSPLVSIFVFAGVALFFASQQLLHAIIH